MSDIMCKVEIGGIVREYPMGIPYGEIAAPYQEKSENPIILAKADGRLRELHRPLVRDCRLEFITTGDDLGHKSYKRSVSLMLLRAIYRVAGKENIEKVVLHYSVSEGFYYTIQGKVKMNQELLDSIKADMVDMVHRKVPIIKKNINTYEAIRRFHEYGMYDKEKLFRYRRVSKVNIYSLENYEDYFYGFMAQNTEYLKYFDLFLYDEGFVLQMPTLEKPKVVPPFEPQEKIFRVQQKSGKWGEMLNVDTVGELNEAISQDKIRQLILIQEALQEGEIGKIAEEISKKENVKFVMIAGPSSSGKTTFSHRLSVQLSVHGMKPHPIAVDNYFVDREKTPLDENGEKNYECLGAIDVERFNQDMNDLLQGKRVEMPEFNFKQGKREYKGNFLQLGPNDLLVIEGIHCMNDKLSYTLPKESKYKIYISALTQLNIDEHNRIPTTDGRLIRRMVRDNRTRGTSAQNTMKMWPSVRRGEEENIFPYQESADVMFNSALIYELAALKCYVEPILFQIPEEAPEYIEAKRLLKFLDYFVGIPADDIPKNSILREFLGGGCFNL